MNIPRWILSSLLITGVSAHANVDIDAAYKREYIFLKSQIKELKKQKKQLQKQFTLAVREAERDLDRSQEKVVSLNAVNERLGEKLFKIEQSSDINSENKELLDNTMKQAALSLNIKGEQIPEINTLFDQALIRLEQSSQIRQSIGNFYLESGQLVKGDLLQIGNIATVGRHNDTYHLLAPAGQGTLKSWKETQTGEALFAGNFPATFPLFIYEGLDKAIEKRKDKSVVEFIAAGGTIAWVIVFMGLFALLLCALRAFSLNRYAAETNYIDEQCQADDPEKTLDSLEGMSSTSSQKRLFLKILGLKKEKGSEALHDVAEEGMIQEHKLIDRYGALILVFAAVAPLLGLLGTVTGMISTFDIITEHGTGDPKLLSHGISEALITTELGLVVAIPTLLLGNILSGWGKNLKMTLDKIILKLTNEA